MPQRIYMAIDLKSFYASVECVERGLDPLQTNLVVADPSRTEKTICLAVSPALKAYGIPGRARLFEVIQKVGQVNAMRRLNAPNRTLTGIAYLARGSLASPADIRTTKKYVRKAIQYQLEGKGFSMVEILSPCPTNWNLTPLKSWERMKNEVAAVYPTGEFIDNGKEG